MRGDRTGGPGDRVARAGPEPHVDDLNRGRRSIAVDLKRPESVDLVLELSAGTNALIEGFRPGVAERLGIGPDVCLEHNRRWCTRACRAGEGAYASTPGHDINFIALAGAPHPMGYQDRPPRPPLNLVGDFGGGGMLLAFDVVCALFETRALARGQVVDAAVIDGRASLMAMTWSFLERGRWSDERGVNFLDGSAPYDTTYETGGGGRYVSIGCVEDRFYDELLTQLGLAGPEWADRHDRSRWPAQREELARIFRTRTWDEWCARLEGTEVCFAPVLSMN